MNLKDIAKLAGVSASTVSRVVNGGDTSAASRETQEKIWSVVRMEGYVPNQTARSLRQPQSQSKRTIREIDCVYARTAGSLIDPFFTTLMHHVEVEAMAQGYNLRYQFSIADLEPEKFSSSLSNVEAAIVLGRIDERALKSLRKYYRHLVCTGLQETDFPVDQVIASGYRAAYSCVEYLIALGHRDICYLGETINEQRYQGYADAMRAHGVEDSLPYVAEAPFSPAGGFEAVNRLLESERPFTAILCANDMLAMGAMKALREHGLRIPRDVSLVGINDMETVRYLDPMLTTVHVPLEEMGRHAARLLIDQIEGGHRLPAKVILPAELVLRESCGPIGDQQKKGKKPPADAGSSK